MPPIGITHTKKLLHFYGANLVRKDVLVLGSWEESRQSRRSMHKYGKEITQKLDCGTLTTIFSLLILISIVFIEISFVHTN